MPRIQPFLDIERHITISSRARSARARPGHVSPATTNVFAEVDPEGEADSLAKCGVDCQASGEPLREDAGVDGRRSGSVTRELMWRSTGSAFEGTGGSPGQRHIT